MRVLNFFKFIVVVMLIWVYWYFYTLLDINKPKIIDSSLEKERQTAFFLNLNEEVLSEISNKKQYSDLRDMPKEEQNKTGLFESLNKIDYNF